MSTKRKRESKNEELLSPILGKHFTEEMGHGSANIGIHSAFGMIGGNQSESVSPLPFGEEEDDRFGGAKVNLNNSLELPPEEIENSHTGRDHPQSYADELMKEIRCVPLALGTACEGTWGGVIENGALDFGLWRNLIQCDGHYFLREYEGYDEPNRKEFICRVIFIGPETERSNYSVEMKFASENVEFVWRGTPISFHTSEEELDLRNVESLILRPKAVHLLHADSTAVHGEDAQISDWFTITKRESAETELI
jgi:hypothetical protein